MGWANYSSLVRTMTNLGGRRLPIKLLPEVNYSSQGCIELLGMTFAWIRMGSHEFARVRVGVSRRTTTRTSSWVRRGGLTNSVCRLLL